MDGMTITDASINLWLQGGHEQLQHINSKQLTNLLRFRSDFCRLITNKNNCIPFSEEEMYRQILPLFALERTVNSEKNGSKGNRGARMLMLMYEEPICLDLPYCNTWMFQCIFFLGCYCFCLFVCFCSFLNVS
jgi:hypothetical protein